MSTRKFRALSGWPMGLVALIVLLAACVPPASLSPTEPATPIPSATPPAPATPTPEIFNPLVPSPTASASTLPLTCQVTDLNVFVNDKAGYCFAYPEGFDLDDALTPGEVSLFGPTLEQTSDPLRVSLEITAQPAPMGSDLNRLVDAYLTQSGFQNSPWTIERSSLPLGGQAAVSLEDVPGRLSSRVVLTLHNDVLLTLRFHPSDAAIAEAGVEALFQTVTGSFVFLSETSRSQLEAKPQPASWNEFGQEISLAVDARLAPWVEAGIVPAVPLGDGLYSGSHPAYVQFRLLGFQGGRRYELPFNPVENQVAQVMVFQTGDFAGFGDDQPYGFPSQWRALMDLLETGITPERCAQPLSGPEQALPFLPWLNMQQVFCAQPRLIEFSGGEGLRYITYYAQGLNPVLDQQVFYTYQGLTRDGRFFISAVFPVATGIFPTEPSPPDLNYLPVLTEQLGKLNRQPEDAFSPSLAALDTLVSSIRLEATTAEATATPAPPPTPDPNEGVGDVVYRDNLDGTGNWYWTFEDEAIRFGVSGEEKRLNSIAKVRGAWRFTISPDTVKVGDQQIRVSAHTQVCAGSDEYALLFRGNVTADTAEYSFYVFKLRCDGQARVERLQGVDSFVLVDWTASPAIRAGANADNALMVWAYGDELRFYVNDHYLFSAGDAALADGFYGFYLYDRTNGDMSVSWKGLEARSIQLP